MIKYDTMLYKYVEDNKLFVFSKWLLSHKILTE